MAELRHTIFCDIDGTIIKHNHNLVNMIMIEPSLLPDVLETFCYWRQRGFYIVLTTARPEGCRNVTERQLESLGVFWDQLIMGLPQGPRVVINDEKPDGTKTAIGICLPRNEGLTNVKI